VLFISLSNTICMASTSAPEAADARFHPIPTSVIIVNEATPLVSQDQQLAGSQIHADPSFNLWSCVRLSSDESIREKQLQGLVLLVISSFLFAGVSVIVKLLGNTYPSFEIVLARGCVQLPLGLLGCAIVRVNPLGKKGVRKWIFFRALASSIALSFFFYSLTQLPLIDATGNLFCIFDCS
jgi:drug/metabolite transporter (DMT)-like permease